jgi:galactokinase
MNAQKRKEWMTAQFVRPFGDTPEFWTRAPGRVDLMGSHTDYNDGFILTMTIDRDTWLAARRRSDGMVRVTSLDLDDSGEFSLAQIAFDQQKPWINYVSGVAKVLQEAGLPLCGFDGLIHSTVPLASGLSSSAALEMAVARMFEQVSAFSVDKVTLARLAQKAENEFVGVNCGILDQYTSSAGREGCALLLDARSLESSDIPIAPGLRVVICDTRAPRTLSGTEYSTRRAQCEEGVRLIRSDAPAVAALRDVPAGQFAAYEPLLPPITARRCRFIIEENARVLDLAQALPTGDAAWLGALWAASYAGAQELYEICVPAMDAMLAAMRSAPGFIAGRQAGAGFGGCMVALTTAGQTQAFIDHVHQRYCQSTGIAPNLFAVAATDGAGVLA